MTLRTEQVDAARTAAVAPGAAVDAFSAEHDELRTHVQRLVEREFVDHGAGEVRGLPSGRLARLGELGLLGVSAPARWGGQGGDAVAATVVVDELARADVGLAMLVAGHLASLHALAGRAEAGESADADGAAADLVAGARLARLDDDGAQLPPPGSAHSAEDAMRVPTEPAAADLHRVLHAAAAVGAGWALWGRTRTYAQQRTAFGRTLMGFQVTRHRLADAAARLEAAQWHVAATARRLVIGTVTDAAPPGAASRACRLATTRTVFAVADECLQQHGGFGYAEDSGVARTWRDLRGLALVAEADVRDVAAAAAAPAALGPSFGDGTDACVAARERARGFVSAEIEPHVEAWEAAGDFPRDVFTRAGEAGLLGLKVARDWGGQSDGDRGADLARHVAWVEELARAGSGGVAADLGAHSDLALLYVDAAGSDAQRARWLAPGVRGETIGALAITEPDAGSDVAGIRTRARRDGDAWVLEGAKTYITGGSWCDWMVVAAKTDPDAGHAGITLFVVDGDASGVTRSRLSMLGWRTSHTGEIALAGVRVDDSRRLGEVGDGFAIIIGNFVWERLMLAVGAVAAAEAALASLAGRAAAVDELADLTARVTQARALTARALQCCALGTDVALETAAMAKLVTQRLAVEAADLALRTHTASGSPEVSAAERWLRDARLGPIGGGTDEIMRELIAKTRHL